METVQSVLLISAFKNNHIAEIKFYMNHGTLEGLFVFIASTALFICLFFLFSFQVELRCSWPFYKQEISILLLFSCCAVSASQRQRWEV